MQPVFGYAVIGNMVICLGAVGGQQKQHALPGDVLAIVDFDVRLAPGDIIKLVIAGSYVGGAPRAPAFGIIPRKVLKLYVFKLLTENDIILQIRSPQYMLIRVSRGSANVKYVYLIVNFVHFYYNRIVL